MTAPTAHEIQQLAAHVRKLQDAKDEAFNFRKDSDEAFLAHEIALKRWAMAHTHLGERIREFIESGQSGVVRP